MDNTSGDIPWTFETLRESAYRISRRREALSVGLLEGGIMLGLVWGATCDVMPGHQPALLWPGALCLGQDVLFEFLWPERVVRLRSAIYGPVTMIAIVLFRWPYVVNYSPTVMRLLILAGLTGCVLICVAIVLRWPVRRVPEQVAVDRWMKMHRRDLKRAQLDSRHDVMGVATPHGSMRLKRLGDYILIGHGLMKLCDMDQLRQVSIKPVEPISDDGRTRVAFECGRYRGEGKTTKTCIDRVREWQDSVACNHHTGGSRKPGRIGYFRFLEDDIEHPWGM